MSTTVYIPPFDDAAKQRLLKAVANRGQANGIEAAAHVIVKVIEEHMRVVGTNTLRDVVAVLREKAAAIRKDADAAIAELEAANN